MVLRVLKFQAKLYRISKGSGRQHAYKATIKRKTFTQLGLSEKDGMLLKIEGYIFPTVLVKVKNVVGNFTYGFSVPKKIGDVINKKEIQFEVVSYCKAQRRMYKSRCASQGISSDIFKISSLGTPIYMFELRDHIIAWIYSKGCKPISLPKVVQFEKGGYNLLELVGAFFCEGGRAKKKGHNLDRLSFSNADPKQIKWFLDAMENLLGIKKKMWHAHILYSKVNEKTADSLKEFWSQYDIDKNYVWVYENRTIRSEHGICNVYISNSTLGEIFSQIVEYCKNMALKNKENAINFFRGASRGDVGIACRGGTLKAVTFSTKELGDVKFFKKVCNKLSLKTSNPYFNRGCWNIYIIGFNNFRKLVELNVISHSKRKSILLDGFLKTHKSIFYKYLKAVAKGADTAAKAARYLDVSIITSRALFSKLKKEGYLKGKIEGKYKEIVHQLTRQGEETFNFYQDIERR